MNNVPYLHYPKDYRSLIKSYFGAISLLWIFGFYKNSILLYQTNFISFLDTLIPIYFLGISVFISWLVAFILKKNLCEYILYGLILASCISINTNIFIYPILLFVSLFITSFLEEKKEFNIISLSHLFLVLALFLYSYSYLNVAEKIGAFNYNYFDLFLGYGVGGIASSSFLFIIIAFIILLFNPFYKKMIPIMSSLSFMAVLLCFFIFTHNYSYLEIALNGSAYFAFVFVATYFYATPLSKKGMIYYGISIGITTALLSTFLPIYEAPFICIFIISCFALLFDRIFQKKHLHS